VWANLSAKATPPPTAPPPAYDDVHQQAANALHIAPVVQVVTTLAGGDADEDGAPSSPPPSYHLHQHRHPHYHIASFEEGYGTLDLASANTTLVPVVDADGDVVIQGMPVGTLLLFFANLLISASFDLLGYLGTSMFASSHAARFGSLSGLGITMMRFGMLLCSDNGDFDERRAGRDDASPDTSIHHIHPHPVRGGVNLFGWLMMILGLFITGT
jgi:hypothetical protein